MSINGGLTMEIPYAFKTKIRTSNFNFDFGKSTECLIYTICMKDTYRDLCLHLQSDKPFDLTCSVHLEIHVVIY